MIGAVDWQTLQIVAALVVTTTAAGGFAMWWLLDKFMHLRAEIQAMAIIIRKDICNDLHDMRVDMQYLRGRIDHIANNRE